MHAFEKKMLLLLDVIPETDELHQILSDLLKRWKSNSEWWAPEVFDNRSYRYWDYATEMLETHTVDRPWFEQCKYIFNTPVANLV